MGLLFVSVIEGVILGDKISEPYGLTSDLANNVYLVDSGNDRLIKFDSDLNPVEDAGGYGSSDGLLNSPTHISLGSNLNLYVSDGGNQRISIFDTRLNYARQVRMIDQDDPSKFGFATGLRVNEYGEIWVADRDKSRIWLFSNIGSLDRSIGGIESAGDYLLNPAGMASDDRGRVYVCDKGNHDIKIYDNFGISLRSFGADYVKSPSGIAFDNHDNIWVADADRPGIFCFNQNGDMIYSVEKTGLGVNYSLKEPVDLTILSDNRLIVSDFGKNRLVVFQILYP